MKVICRRNTSKDLDLSEITTIISYEVEYSIEVGEEYLVMGMQLYDKCLYYIIDSYERPGSYPYVLFEVSDPRIHTPWYFRTFSREESPYLRSVWGFYDFCMVDDYHDLLMELDSKAVEIYFQRKAEVLQSIEQ